VGLIQEAGRKEHGESRRKEVEEDMEGNEMVNEKKSVRGRQ